MSIASELRKSGLLTYSDSAEIIHHRYARMAHVRARYFKLFRRRVAKKSHQTPGLYPARLVAFDLILPSQIDIAALVAPYRHFGKPMIEWMPNDGLRIDRRQISGLTLLSKCSLKSDIKPTAQLAELLESDPYYKKFPKADQLFELEVDMCHWAHRKLSGPMAAHVTNLAPLWATSRDTLTRLEFKAIKQSELATVNEELELEMASFLDAAQEASADSIDMALIKLAIELIKYDGDKSDEENYYCWISALLNLKEQVRDSSLLTAILICWMIDLFESGTYRSAHSRIETRISYVRKGVLKIWIALQATKKNPLLLTEEELQAAYVAIVEDRTCSDPNKTGSAISNFQHYAHEVWDFPEVSLRISKYIPKATPRVQIVHSHEKDACILWFAECNDADTYALNIASLQTEILFDRPIRIEELSNARIGNVSIADDLSLAEIELYPAPGMKFKNTGSHRPLTITSKELIRKLSTWIKRREADGGKDNNFLFGIDAQPGRYRPSLVKALQRIALKTATGDPTMTIHALRHTSSSRDFAECQNTEVSNTNLHFELAQRKGHIAPSMGIEFYSHQYEFGLANELQRIFRQEIEFADTDAITLTSITPGNVRTTSSRSKGRRNISDVIFDRILVESDSVLLSPISEIGNWTTPDAPRFSIAMKVSLSPLTILRVLDKLRNCSVAETAILCDLSSSTVQFIFDFIHKEVNVRRSIKSLKKRTDELPVTSFDESLSYLGIDVLAAKQIKYSKIRLALAKSIDCELVSLLSSNFWDHIKSKTYLNLNNAGLAVELLKFLKSCGLAACDFLVRFQPSKKSRGALGELMLQVQRCFSVIWNALPDTEEDDMDHGIRPSAYLLFPAHPGARASRLVDVKGLIALLYCTRILVNVTKENNNDGS